MRKRLHMYGYLISFSCIYAFTFIFVMQMYHPMLESKLVLLGLYSVFSTINTCYIYSILIPLLLVSIYTNLIASCWSLLLRTLDTSNGYIEHTVQR